jgi:hypothetical protein
MISIILSSYSYHKFKSIVIIRGMTFRFYLFIYLFFSFLNTSFSCEHFFIPIILQKFVVFFFFVTRVQHEVQNFVLLFFFFLTEYKVQNHMLLQIYYIIILLYVHFYFLFLFCFSFFFPLLKFYFILFYFYFYFYFLFFIFFILFFFFSQDILLRSYLRYFKVNYSRPKKFPDTVITIFG